MSITDLKFLIRIIGFVCDDQLGELYRIDPRFINI